MMKRIAVIAAAATIAVFGSAPSLAADTDTDASLVFSGGSAAAGLGYTWASGTLTYNGHAYPVRLRGITIGDVGAGGFKGTASIHNLTKLEDFDGTYGGGQVGFTVGAGGEAQALKNEKGVVMYVASESRGLKVSVSLDGVNAQLQK